MDDLTDAQWALLPPLLPPRNRADANAQAIG